MGKGEQTEDQFLTCPFPQEETMNAGRLTIGPAKALIRHMIKRLWLTVSVSSFYCLRVLRIGDPKTETACIGHRKSHIAECNYCGGVDGDIGGHSGRGQGGRDDGGSVMVTGVVMVMVMETLKS